MEEPLCHALFCEMRSDAEYVDAIRAMTEPRPFPWHPVLKGLLNRHYGLVPGKDRMFVVSDTSIRKDGWKYDAVLCTNETSLRNWNDRRVAIRREFGMGDRRLHFKKLSTNHALWAAVAPSLDAAAQMEGVCVVVAIPDNVRDEAVAAVQSHIDRGEADLEHNWKAEYYMDHVRLTCTVATVIGALAVNDRPVDWISDHEPAFGHEAMCRDLLKTMGKASVAHIGRPLGETRVTTPLISTDADFGLRDILAIPDLAAGAVGAMLSDLRHKEDQRYWVRGSTANRDRKVEAVGGWFFANDGMPLRRLAFEIAYKGPDGRSSVNMISGLPLPTTEAAPA